MCFIVSPQRAVYKLEDKYRVYAITFEPTMDKRPRESVMFVHVARPISLKTFCDSFIFQHLELTNEKGDKFKTNAVCGIQKVPNQVTPEYELTMDGLLKDIPK